MSNKNGSPAFPIAGRHPGMSLRDYFAAKAMHAALMTVQGAEDENQAITGSVRIAYKIADAMLEERAK